MNKILSLFIYMLLSVSCHAQTQPLNFTHLGTGEEVILQTMNLQTLVYGNHATHSWTMIFKNNSTIAQEVNLTFPLPDKSNITAYSIDIKGKMRKAVPVEKHKATQVLEAIENRNVDPGLLERIDGNHFKTRIFPVLPNQTRKICIEYDEELSMNSGQLAVVLPFSYSKKVSEMHIDIRFVKPASQPIVNDKIFDVVKFNQIGQDYLASAHLSNVIPSRPVSITVEQAAESCQVITERKNGSTYFLVNKFTEGDKRLKSSPKKITILWDNSLSSLDRDFKKELDFLEQYFLNQKNLVLSLVVFNQEIETIKQFQIKDGQWKALKHELETLTYDGATQLGILQLNRFQCDEYLLFSDGHQTYCKDQIQLDLKKPVYCIASSPKTDFSKLHQIAFQTGGEVYNLMKTNPIEAAESHRYESYKLLNIKKGSTVFEVYPSNAITVKNSISIAGKTISPNEQITLQFGYGKQITKEEVIHLNVQQADGKSHSTSKSSQPSSNEQVTSLRQQSSLLNSNTSLPQLQIDRIWAQKKLEELDLDFERNKNIIEEIGKTFGLVTRNTSLLVLEDASDYVRYNIEPPKELLTEYRAISKEERASLLSVETDLIERTKSMNQELIFWWNRKAILKKVKGSSADTYTWSDQHSNYSTNGTVTNGIYESEAAPALGVDENATPAASEGPANTPPPFPHLNRERVAFAPPVIRKAEEVREEERPPLMSQQASPSRAANQTLNLTLNYSSSNNSTDSTMSEVSASQGKDLKSSATSQTIDDFSGQHTDYLQLIQQTKRDQQYKKYLELRPQYLQVPVFYYQVASYFLQSDRKVIGLKILSNLAELEYENYELYKMLGYKLRQMNEHDAACSTFKKVLEWRPNEPQSYRDYAISLSEAGKYQLALDHFNLALSKSYDENKNMAYDGIEEIILMEIKQLIYANRQQLNVRNTPTSIQRNLPCDVRVILNWNMIDTDIDLWVTDPSKEQCKYDHAITKMGGRISNDFTDGLGPEQFILKTGRKGKYIIQADFYGQTQVKIAGATTVLAEVYTHYSTPQQTKKLITFQLQEGEDRTRMIGEFEL